MSLLLKFNTIYLYKSIQNWSNEFNWRNQLKFKANYYWMTLIAHFKIWNHPRPPDRLAENSSVIFLWLKSVLNFCSYAREASHPAPAPVLERHSAIFCSFRQPHSFQIFKIGIYVPFSKRKFYFQLIY